MLLWILRMLQMPLMQKALAEMIGTFAMIFAGGGIIVLSEKYPNVIHAYFIPVTWGLVICAMIFAMGKISGAHFNPAVTLAFAATKHIPVSQVPVYWLSQCAGGLTAASLLIVLRKI